MTTTSTRAARASNGLLVLIVLAVGTMAGAASFRHVHDWTMHNSPAATPDWFGWANALITELIPTAALIIIARRRKNNGGHIGYPMFLLVAAVSLSLTAQLAVAKPTVFGWMVSALPSLAFFALSKLVFSATKDTTPAADPAPTAPAVPGVSRVLPVTVTEPQPRPTTPAPTPRPARPAPASSFDTAPGTSSSATPEPAALTPSAAATPTRNTPDTHPADPAVTRREPVPAVSPVPGKPTSTMGDLLPGARMFAQTHHQAHGTPITPGQLAVRMRINTATAERLLRALDTPTATRRNGATVTGVTA